MSGFFRNMGRGETCCTDCGQATPCEGCCPTELPSWEWRSRSASKSKVGFNPYISTSATCSLCGPNDRYLALSWSGVSWTTSDTFASRYSGERVFNLAGGFDVDTLGEETTVASSPCTPGDWTPDPFPGVSYCGALCYLDGDDLKMPITGGSCPPPEDAPCESDAEATFSQKYTNLQLITYTQASMPGDWPNTTAGTLRSLADTGLTYSERQAEWRVTAPAGLVAGRTYRLYYLVRFTPTGGSAEDGDEQYIEISGDDAGDPIAWQALDVPETNGTNTIVLVRWECEPFEE